MSHLVPNDLAARLRGLTSARVGLGRTGVSQQTSDLLDFQRAHAQARDAVNARLHTASLAAELRDVASSEVLRLHSAAPDRVTYLQRPDMGRALDASGSALLRDVATRGFDLVIVVVDGLSALAVERHAPALLRLLLPRLNDWHIAPLCVVEQGRVAIGDPIGNALDAALCVVLIGERPGLSSPDSLGAYVTWQPQPGRTDAERNCISNIRVGGLGYAAASAQLEYLLREARRRELTGVELKEASSLLGEGQG